MIHICGPRDPAPKGVEVINTTSRSNNWSRGLSPFILGPVKILPTGEWLRSKNMENGWQFLKVYREHVDKKGNPNKAYWEWANNGWNNPRAVRYPMGKDRIPLYSLWANRKLDYISARKQIYCPLYAGAVEKTEAYHQLEKIWAIGQGGGDDLWLWDFDGYDHRKLGMNYRDVLNCHTRKMGHAFVLAMMLTGKRRWENA